MTSGRQSKRGVPISTPSSSQRDNKHEPSLRDRQAAQRLAVFSTYTTPRSRRPTWGSTMSDEAALSIQRWGNSLGLRLPSGVARAAGLHAGQRVNITIEHGNLVIRPVAEPMPSLAGWLARFDPGGVMVAEVMPTEPWVPNGGKPGRPRPPQWAPDRRGGLRGMSTAPDMTDTRRSPRQALTDRPREPC